MGITVTVKVLVQWWWSGNRDGDSGDNAMLYYTTRITVINKLITVHED
jgi:hypothetical protein